MRSALKATVPVMVACAVGGALAPAVAFAVAAIVALPALAVVGELRSAPGWRARARLPLSYAIHLSRALGHAARVALPVALLGVVASRIPGVPTEPLLRATGAAGMSVFAWLAIARLPYSHDRSATALRQGRDVVWRAFVGESGRSRRSVYAMWAVCLFGALAVAANYALWWPLPVR